MEIEYQGDLHCEAVHVQSGHRLATDAPLDNQGKGETFSPTDLVATGYATCIATILGILARKHGTDLKGMKLTVIKEMAPKPTRRIGSLLVEIHMPPGVEPALRQRFSHAADLCPVGQSLHPDVETDVVIRYPD
ncbi:MAG: OsmC family protein [Acidobacteria bacterium]|nr:OsmC family protein [Acidobacteriota bacterium]